MESMPSYEERIKNPNLSLINFSLAITSPSYKSLIWEKYKIDVVFKREVDFKMHTDVVFKKNFERHFDNYINPKTNVK